MYIPKNHRSSFFQWDKSNRQQSHSSGNGNGKWNGYDRTANLSEGDSYDAGQLTEISSGLVGQAAEEGFDLAVAIAEVAPQQPLEERIGVEDVGSGGVPPSLEIAAGGLKRSLLLHRRTPSGHCAP
jgi:hypothetical protein